MKKNNLILSIFIIVCVVVSRLIPHPPNFVPVVALALFAGAYMDKRYALIIPIAAMAISDFFLGFHDTILFVYLSYILIGVLGIYVKNKKSAGRIFATGIISSILFFLITNFGVWLTSGMYEMSLRGVIDCYYLAIPFLRNSILGDLFYVTLFFGGYEFIKIYVFSGVKKSIFNR